MPRGPRGEKRPADVIGAAVMVGKLATGEITETLPKKEERMDREHVKGAAGKVSKGTAGKVRDDKKLQGKGKSDKSKGLPGTVTST